MSPGLLCSSPLPPPPPRGCVQLRRPNTCNVLLPYDGTSTKASCTTSTRQRLKNQMNPYGLFTALAQASRHLVEKNPYSPRNNWQLHNLRRQIRFYYGLLISCYLSAAQATASSLSFSPLAQRRPLWPLNFLQSPC